MPITLSTLFTTPQDVWDVLSVEGVDLSEDDHNLASGQVISVTADAAVGATTLTVAATIVALLKGTQLTFEGPGMTAPVTATLSAAANIGATSLAVTALTVTIPSGSLARDGGVNAVTGARLLVSCTRGTSKCKLYLNGRYDDSQLSLCGSVNNWATICACKWICTRRRQGCPESIKDDYDEAIEEMKMVQRGDLMLEDVGTRGVDWPSVSNITVNPAYDGMRARVQSPMSEATPTAYGQFIDWNSAASIAW